MTDEQPEVTEIPFVSAQDDAAIRLECFRLAAGGAQNFSAHIAQAKTLYDWVMDWETEDAGEPGIATGEEQCTRKH